MSLSKVYLYLFELESRRLDEGEEEVERDEDGRGHDQEEPEGLAVPRVNVRVVVRQRRVLYHRDQKETLQKNYIFEHPIKYKCCIVMHLDM